VPEHVDSLEPIEDWQRQTYDRGKKRKNYNNRSGLSGRPKSYSTPDGERLHGNCREIDKDATNVKILKKNHPAVCVLHKDLAEGSSPVNGWSEELIGCHALSLRMHRLAGLDPEEFVRNNVVATERLLEAAVRYKVPYIVSISSSVVN
jgi:nucleoside-diphosphate-sugar epimerase